MKLRVLLPVLVGILTVAACGSDDGAGTASASGSASGSGSAAFEKCEIVGGTDAERDAEVHVTLDEWTITLDTHSVAAGVVEFDAVNEGVDHHELVIVKGAKPDALTIGDEGLDEEALPDGAEVLGEIEGFPGDEECAANFDLEAGDYTLLCNIFDKSEHEAHAKEGMVTAFTVT